MIGFLPIDDPSRVSEARRLVRAAAREAGLNEPAVANAEVVASEMASNLLKHAQRGEMQFSTLTHQGLIGLDILSIDRGPGIASIEECLRDGYSRTGTSGTGLGAISRMSGAFDTFSELGKGTVLVSRIGGENQGGITVGFAGRPVSGEEVSGDAWAMRRHEDISLFIVADGLGHGVLASEASAEAVSAFKTSNELDPVPLVQRVHRALRGTRGAAVAVACLDHRKRVIQYSGIGNISGVIAAPIKSQFMISHNGTAGHEATRVQEFSYAFPEGAVLIMHSDGLATSWNLAAYPGLRSRHPSVIAATLYRDATRLRDDVCVVVAKETSK